MSHSRRMVSGNLDPHGDIPNGYWYGQPPLNASWTLDFMAESEQHTTNAHYAL